MLKLVILRTPSTTLLNNCQYPLIKYPIYVSDFDFPPLYRVSTRSSFRAFTNDPSPMPSIQPNWPIVCSASVIGMVQKVIKFPVLVINMHPFRGLVLYEWPF